MYRAADDVCLKCKQCGDEMSWGWARLCVYCKKCMEKAMDELTEGDIAQCVTRLIHKRACLPGQRMTSRRVNSGE